MLNTSKLLLDERPLQVPPKLACLIGLNESIVLQQLHYWLIKERHVFDGISWIYNSYPEWKKKNFPFWSVETIKRTITSLEKKKLIRSAYLNTLKQDRTKWYTINYEEVDRLASAPSCQNDLMVVSKCSDPRARQESESGVPETSTEITHKSPTEHKSALPAKPQSRRLRSGKESTGFYLKGTGLEHEALSSACLRIYYEMYAVAYHAEHCKIKQAQLYTLYANLDAGFTQHGVTNLEDVFTLLDDYFSHGIHKTDGNVNAFAQPGVLNLLACRLSWGGVDMDALPNQEHDYA